MNMEQTYSKVVTFFHHQFLKSILQKKDKILTLLDGGKIKYNLSNKGKFHYNGKLPSYLKNNNFLSNLTAPKKNKSDLFKGIKDNLNVFFF